MFTGENIKERASIWLEAHNIQPIQLSPAIVWVVCFYN